MAFGTTLFNLSVIDLTGAEVPNARFRSPIAIAVTYTDADVLSANGSGMLMGLLITAFVLIFAGGYYLRQTKG